MDHASPRHASRRVHDSPELNMVQGDEGTTDDG